MSVDSVAVMIGQAVTPLASFNIFQEHMVALIIPVMLLLFTVIMFSIDFGVIGIGMASSITLIILMLLGVVPLISLYSTVSLVIIILITLFKVTQ